MQAAELNALRARAECLVDGASMEAAYDRLAEQPEKKKTPAKKKQTAGRLKNTGAKS